MAVNLSMLAGAGAQFFDNNGDPLTGGKLYTYAAGTTTPLAAYTTSAGNVAHANPIILDAAGRVPSGGEVWLTRDVDYKFVLATSTDVVLGTYDNVSGNGSGIFSAFAASSGSSLVGFLQAGAGAVARTVQDKLREWVNAADFPGADIGARVNAALAAGHLSIRVNGTHTLSTQIVLNTLSEAILDLRDSTITAANALNVSLIRLLSCQRCQVWPGTINGNAAGQSSSSFGIDLNGGSQNRVVGGRITNCKTYGCYIIACDYALIESLQSDNNQQAGIAGDTGSADCYGVRIVDCLTFNNGLSGTGALSGVHIEGNHITGFYFREVTCSGLVSFSNRAAGLNFQNVRGYTLSRINAWANYSNGIALASCLYGSGGQFSLDNNDVGGTGGYQNGLVLDDTGVTPSSQYNNFTGINSRNHAGFACIEKGTATNNGFFAVSSSSDGGVFSLGASSTSIGVTTTGGFSGQFVGTGSSSGVGYGVGAGGSVTQLTSKATGVTLNRPSGRITCDASSLAANTTTSFTLTNSAISSTDHLLLNVVSGGTPGSYLVNARPSNGQAEIEIRNVTGGALAEAIVIGFAVIKGAVS